MDGSGWRAVCDLLTGDGYHPAVVQNPTLSLQGDTPRRSRRMHRRALRRGVGSFLSGLYSACGIARFQASSNEETISRIVRGSAEGAVAGVGAVAVLEVPPHDPVAKYPAVGAGQHQVGGFGAGWPCSVWS